MFVQRGRERVNVAGSAHCYTPIRPVRGKEPNATAENVGQWSDTQETDENNEAFTADYGLKGRGGGGGGGLEQRLGPRRGFLFLFPPQRQAHMTEPNTGGLLFDFQGNVSVCGRNFF